MCAPAPFALFPGYAYVLYTHKVKKSLHEHASQNSALLHVSFQLLKTGALPWTPLGTPIPIPPFCPHYWISKDATGGSDRYHSPTDKNVWRRVSATGGEVDECWLVWRQRSHDQVLGRCWWDCPTTGSRRRPCMWWLPSSNCSLSVSLGRRDRSHYSQHKLCDAKSVTFTTQRQQQGHSI